MTTRSSSHKRPRRAQSSRQLPIACHGAIKFLPRNTFWRGTRGHEGYTPCDSGCFDANNYNMRRAASGFVQILDHRPIPLCAKCLKEAKLALAEIESQIVEN